MKQSVANIKAFNGLEALFQQLSQRLCPSREPAQDRRLLTKACNFRGDYALGPTSEGMAVMRGDSVIAKSTSLIVEDLAEEKRIPAIRDPARKQQEVCGAMSLQRSASASESTPQKFVRLVGCRDPKNISPVKR
jgi:hypothetical protein